MHALVFRDFSNLLFKANIASVMVEDLFSNIADFFDRLLARDGLWSFAGNVNRFLRLGGIRDVAKLRLELANR